jgi:hypothetical protein
MTGLPPRLRKGSILRQLLLVAAAILCLTLPARAFDPGFRLPLSQHLSGLADDLRRNLDLNSPRQVALRSYSNAALFAAAIQNNPEKAARLLAVVFSAQDPDTGNLPWLQPGRVMVRDSNGIEFATQAWGPLLLGFADRLPAPTRDALAQHARAALPALAQHNPPVGYTNIYLMNAVNTLLIGQALGDEGAIRRGRARLESWRETVRRDGIREFNSPTYYAVDLNALVSGYLYTPDPEDRRRFKDFLDYFWSDIAAHTLEGKLVGPRSRDYDIPFGEGQLNVYLAAEGWKSLKDLRDVSPELIYALLNMGPDGYRVGPEIAALAERQTRTVLGRWGSAPGQTRTLHVDGRAAIGSVGGGTLSSSDKLFTIDLRRGPERSVTIGFVPATADNPFSERLLVAEGRNIFRHPPVNAGMAQWGGWVLGSYDINPSRERAATNFTTSLLLPLDAEELLLDGRPFRGEVLQAHEGSTVALRVGESCAAIRLVRTSSSSPPELTTRGNERVPEVVRLVIPQAPESQRAQVAFLARAGRCGPDGAAGWARPVTEAPVRDTQDERSWSLSATISGHTIGLRRDLRSRRVLELTGEDSAATGPSLSIDGTDLTRSLAGQ